MMPFHPALIGSWAIALLAVATAFGVSSPAIAGERATASSPAPEAISACDQYGESFAALLGTDTCLRIGGRIRADFLSAPFKVKGSPSSLPWPRPAETTGSASVWRRARGLVTSGDVEFDARTPAAFGTMRTYVRVHLHDGDKEPALPFP
ncbi:MAG: porin [Methylobacteriaceae bacterium]|nr:porin [Methylobacteriaceae bacterium]